MQDRYVGDVGDFVKYGLLRALSYGNRLGVAWYLRTDPDTTKADDGHHTTYLHQPEKWRHLDPVLFDVVKGLVENGSRTVAAIQRSGILKEAVFATEPLDISGIPIREREHWRRSWFERVRVQLAGCEIVFADPDNGLYPNHRFRYTQKVNAKRIPLFEANALAAGRSAVIYHHNTRRAGGHCQEVQEWMERLPGCACAYYWKPLSQRTFFVINPDSELEHRLEKFALRWSRYGKLVRKAF